VEQSTSWITSFFSLHPERERKNGLALFFFFPSSIPFFFSNILTVMYNMYKVVSPLKKGEKPLINKHTPTRTHSQSRLVVVVGDGRCDVFFLCMYSFVQKVGGEEEGEGDNAIS